MKYLYYDFRSNYNFIELTNFCTLTRNIVMFCSAQIVMLFLHILCSLKEKLATENPAAAEKLPGIQKPLLEILKNFKVSSSGAIKFGSVCFLPNILTFKVLCVFVWIFLVSGHVLLLYQDLHFALINTSFLCWWDHVTISPISVIYIIFTFNSLKLFVLQ